MIAATTLTRPTADGRPPSGTTARDVLSTTALARAGGAVLAELLDPAALLALRGEADRVAPSATTMYVPDGQGDAGRGDPARWLDSAAGGPALHALYHAPQVRELLASLTGFAWRTTGESGAFSYYRRPGHHLGLHRDIESCEIAVITCVVDDRPAPTSGGGVLVLYPGRTAESVERIAATPDIGAIPVRLSPGQSIVLLGGIVPHRLTPIEPGQRRVIAPLCYRMRTA
jgi:hypothetical protein